MALIAGLGHVFELMMMTMMMMPLNE